MKMVVCGEATKDDHLEWKLDTRDAPKLFGAKRDHGPPDGMAGDNGGGHHLAGNTRNVSRANTGKRPARLKQVTKRGKVVATAKAKHANARAKTNAKHG